MPAVDLANRETIGHFVKRAVYCGYGYSYNCSYGNSRWTSWGRWVTLGCVVFAAFLLFCCCSRFSARRRRKQGAQPFYGTGWLGGNHGPVQYYGENNNAPQQETTTTQPTPYYSNNTGGNTTQQYAAPAYEPNTNAGYYGTDNNNTTNAHSGYYDQNTGYGQQTGVELQQPSNTYQPPTRGEEDAYAPPAGPPPGSAYAPPAGPPPGKRAL